MRTMLAVMMVAICLTPLSFFGSETTSAMTNIYIELNKFGNGSENITIDFPTPGTDSSNSLSIQTGLNVNTCSMNVRAVAQDPGALTGPSDIAIDFGGDSQIEWKWTGAGVGGLGLQSSFIDSKPSLTYNIPWTGGYNNTAQIRLPKNAHVNSAGMNVTFSAMGTPGKILLMYGELPSYSWWTDIQNKLKTFPEFNTVDVMNVNTATPVWNNIVDYSAILVWSDYNYSYAFNNPATLGDLLARYIDAGGAVVLADYAMYSSGNYWLGGRFNTGGYYCIEPAASLAINISCALGTVSQPNHAVLNGVGNISFPYNSTHIVATNATSAGATPIAYYDNGYILAANKTVYGVNRVDLNFWPVPYSDNAYWGFGGDMEKIIKNALLFSGARSANVKLDILGDGSADYQNSNLQGSVAIQDFSAALNNYLSSAPASFTDAYGNSFVDIPINLSSPGMANIVLDKLRIGYDYTTTIGPNPVTGNLTLAISALVPEQQGSVKVKVPIFVTSSTTGMLGMDSLVVKLTPPFHAPSVSSFLPERATTIFENTQLDFGVNVSDMYGNPVTYVWYVDGVRIDETTNNHSVMYDYSSAGNHTAAVVMENGLSDTTVDWTITVMNLNRAPAIDGSEPADDIINIRENGQQNFSVEASDPDDETLSYSWTLDGVVQSAWMTAEFAYTADFLSNGTHKVTVWVNDTGNGSDSRTWTVKVENVNLPPSISDWEPKDKLTIIETQSTTFNIVSSDSDNQTVTTSWDLDGIQIFSGNPYIYRTDHKSAGNHTVKVMVTDGTLSASREWRFTVQNLNRLPVAVIDQPVENADFTEGQAVHLSANASYDPDQDDVLSYTWKEGNVNFSDLPVLDKPFTHGIHTIVLEVRDRNGGISQTTVHIRVRWMEMSLVIAVDPLEAIAGKKTVVIVTLSNVGDTDSTAQKLDILIDGKLLQSRDITALSAGGTTKEEFQWKPTKGKHTITAKIGEQTWNKPITVESAATVSTGPATGDFIPPVLILVVVVVLIAWGMWALRKK